MDDLEHRIQGEGGLVQRDVGCQGTGLHSWKDALAGKIQVSERVL